MCFDGELEPIPLADVCATANKLYGVFTDAGADSTTKRTAFDNFIKCLERLEAFMAHRKETLVSPCEWICLLVAANWRVDGPIQFGDPQVSHILLSAVATHGYCGVAGDRWWLRLPADLPRAVRGLEADANAIQDAHAVVGLH